MLDNIMPMSTTVRHNKFTSTLYSRVIDFIERGKIYAFQEECALVHWGFKRKADDFKYLIDIAAIENIEKFKEIIINDLDYVQPDFVLFKNNPYLSNDRETRTAGCPDLIAEVWSDGNTKQERAFKLDLYSSNPTVEHWYIEQDSNDIECYMGKDKIETQSLKNILVTRGGLQFDLRYLAI
jgi:hypothetical protein